jgi:hypothetical protein
MKKRIVPLTLIFITLLCACDIRIPPPGGSYPTETPTATRTVRPSRTPTDTPQPTPTLTHTITFTPQPSPTISPSPTIIPTATPYLLSLTNWKPFTDELGTQYETRMVQKISPTALEISYHIMPYGWVGVSHDIDPEILFNGTGIGFSMMGGGKPLTLELHLNYAPDETGRSAIFGKTWTKKSASNGWVYYEVLYEELKCWETTPCPRDGQLDLEDVRVIDIAVSHKASEIPGPGFVIVKDFHLLQE